MKRTIKRISADSPWFMIYYDHDPKIWTDAALLPWDGKRGTSYPYDTSKDRFAYYIAADNTVYYSEQDGSDAQIWCPGCQLARHCHHLWQVRQRM